MQVMLGLIGKIHQVDAVNANFENLASKYREVRQLRRVGSGFAPRVR